MKHQHTHGTSGRAHEPAQVATTGFTDPVCGMSVAADSPHRSRHEGNDYYFCPSCCRGKFDANPQRHKKEGERH